MTLSYFTNVMLEEGNREDRAASGLGMLVRRSRRGDCVATGLVHEMNQDLSILRQDGMRRNCKIISDSVPLLVVDAIETLSS